MILNRMLSHDAFDFLIEIFFTILLSENIILNAAVVLLQEFRDILLKTICNVQSISVDVALSAFYENCCIFFVSVFLGSLTLYSFSHFNVDCFIC